MNIHNILHWRFLANKIASFQSRFKKRSGFEMRDKAHKICREFLSGTWKSISSSDMVFRSLSGGLSNLLYYCSLPETHTPLIGEPGQVLLRMYGQLHDGGVDSTVTESVIFMMLAERRLGPKLYGIFPGGRLEEYIPARALTCQELKDSDISATIARKLAKVHSLQVPINKEPTWLFDKMASWLTYARNNVCPNKLKDDDKKLADYILFHNLEEELEWLKHHLQQAKSPVLFCHNDLQEGNILRPEGSQATDDKVVFIDFEFCSYNYRGFDLANHFCEWCFDYSDPKYPHFTSEPENYPTQEQQLHFIRYYLEAASFDKNPDLIHYNTEENILEEIRIFNLASHFLWMLWSIVNAQTSKITFGYWEYGKTRLDCYFRDKSLLLQ
ncbi:choline/ethanolamine kinase-like isoform X1 [Centruroides sculpturatus]|uniref:choline/ethanolamine kinase-like isoform X1 n=1 Tax=Centruroides sculpturatus TaxID=218467 RepID=UPI000C6D91CC|nr:choline/ethanolamine kinase-like isoform X1 [Centruroides sculpturatus]